MSKTKARKHWRTWERWGARLERVSPEYRATNGMRRAYEQLARCGADRKFLDNPAPTSGSGISCNMSIR